MKDKPTKPNGYIVGYGYKWPVYWDPQDGSVFWTDLKDYYGPGMSDLKKGGWVFEPLPSEGVKEVKPQFNTPFKWPDYWLYSMEDNVSTTETTDPFESWLEEGIRPKTGIKVGDNVKHPNHYNQDGQIECIDAIKAALGLEGFAAYCRGNTMKYSWRYKRKGGVEDLKKSQQYLTWLIETEEEIQQCSSR